MKNSKNYLGKLVGLGLLLLLCFSAEVFSQRITNNRGGARPAASRPAANRPSSSRPAISRPTASRPAQSNARPASKPATNAAVRPASKPATGSSSIASSKPASKKGTINGGSNRVTNSVKKESNVTSVAKKNNQEGNRTGNSNKINVDKSRGDVNINVNNSRNTFVRNNRNVAYRPPYRPYPRPPYMWGGYGFSCFRPYYYHPFTPFYWGPVWHPWGFLVATLAVTAIVVSIDDQEYNYDEGVFYVESDGGYVVVEAPQGATVKVIPKESEVVQVSPTVNNYYYGGTFYEQKDGSYSVVPPPAGATVSHLPEGAEEVKVGDETYVKYGDTYYMPVQVDNEEMYEIVQVEEEA